MDQLLFTISLDLLIDDLYVLREALKASSLIEAKRMLESIDEQTTKMFEENDVNYFKRKHLREFCRFLKDYNVPDIYDTEIVDISPA